MLKGLEKLEGYGKSFVRAKRLCTVFLAYFILYGIYWTLGDDFLKIVSFPDALGYIDQYLYYAILVLFSFFLYKALGDISEEVGFEKGTVRSRRCISISVVFVVFTLIKLLLTPLGYSNLPVVILPFMIFEVLWLVYSAVFIYSCYMMIATQEIIDEENRKIREYDDRNASRQMRKKK